MKQKINKRMYLVSMVSIVITMIVVLLVFFNIYRKQVEEDLRIYGEVVKDLDDVTSWDNDKIRITLIGNDGEVLFDSKVDSSQMENHKNRPEIVEAFSKDEGFDVRNSDTVGEDTYYYALLLEDGKVLRVSRNAESISVFIFFSIEIGIIILLALFVLSLFVIRIVNKNLTRPLDELKINHDKMRREFSANVSHELKTPLTAISGYAQLIEQEVAKKEDVPKFAEKIRNESERMLNLINDIIKISELDEKEGMLKTEKIDLYSLAEECIQTLQESADEKKITLHISGEKTIIQGSASMIYEVIYNLLDNAIRYNNYEGKVFVKVGKESGKEYFIVEDSGIGIPKKYQERIFERFYRVDKSHSKVTGGTGLGLSIVKHIIIAHKGKIELESKEGIGTKIKIIFG